MESTPFWFDACVIAVAGVLFYKAYRPPDEPKAVWATGGAGTPFSRRTYVVFGAIVLSVPFVDTKSKVWFLLCFAAFVATAIADMRKAKDVRAPPA